MWKILVVVKSQDLYDLLKEFSSSFEAYEIEFDLTQAPDEALEKLQSSLYHLILAEDNLPLKKCRKILEIGLLINEDLPIIILSKREEKSFLSFKFDSKNLTFLPAPPPLESLQQIIKTNLEKVKLSFTIDYLRHCENYIYSFEHIVGESPAIKEVLGLVKKVAMSNSSVLIEGESGTGKELVAAAIHFNSARRRENFIAVNCAALHENLLESELFGHEKGAYTGADRRRIGRFEQAHKGTLFLDEIGEMSLLTQSKILRILQNQEFERLGGSDTIKIDVRIIAASNKDLGEALQHHEFREDLFYRLSVIPIKVPPLRERKQDILPLAGFFFKKYRAESGKKLRGLHPHTLVRLQNYPWPGNVRELENVIERAIVIADRELIMPEDLLLYEKPKVTPEAPSPEAKLREFYTHNKVDYQRENIESLKDKKESIPVYIPSQGLTLEEVEKVYIQEALRKAHGVQKEAARLLGISPRVMHYKIHKYKINLEDDFS